MFTIDFRPKMDRQLPVSCDNCAWTGKTLDVQPIHDLEERIAPGEVVPAGECPECGALAHLVQVPNCPCGKPAIFPHPGPYTHCSAECYLESKVSEPPTTPKLPTIDDLLDAIKQVESGGDATKVGDGGAAHGAYQIHQAYFIDACVQIHLERGVQPPVPYVAAVMDDHWAREIVKAYWRRYQKSSFDDMLYNPSSGVVSVASETLARTHNDGPAGNTNPATLPYWVKVQAVLLQRGFNV